MCDRGEQDDVGKAGCHPGESCPHPHPLQLPAWEGAAAATGKPGDLTGTFAARGPPGPPAGAGKQRQATVWNSTGNKALYPQTCCLLHPTKQSPPHADPPFPSIPGDSWHSQLHSLSGADILAVSEESDGFPVALKGGTRGSAHQAEGAGPAEAQAQGLRCLGKLRLRCQWPEPLRGLSVLWNP